MLSVKKRNADKSELDLCDISETYSTEANEVSETCLYVHFTPYECVTLIKQNKSKSVDVSIQHLLSECLTLFPVETFCCECL